MARHCLISVVAFFSSWTPFVHIFVHIGTKLRISRPDSRRQQGHCLVALCRLGTPATSALQPLHKNMRALIMAMLLVVGCECTCTCYVTARAMLRMGAKKAVSRREVIDGSSLTKRFYDPDGFRSGLPPGWSPALVLAIGSAAATYGGSRRSQFFDELRELGGGTNNQGKPHVPTVTLSPGRAPGQVTVEIAALASSTDAIDFIWATDADTGEIFEGRKFLPKETPSLVFIVAPGRRIVPSVHSTSDGVWEGQTVVAEV